MRLLVGVFTVIFSAALPTMSVASPCPLANIKNARALHDFLSLRAVQIVKLAAKTEGGSSRLNGVIAPTASFSLGAGDVVVPLGTGAEGARALVARMNADTYRYLGWDYMDMPIDACSSQKISVEFVDSVSKTVSKVEFTFDGGLLLKAAGWSDSFQTGPLRSLSPRR